MTLTVDQIVDTKLTQDHITALETWRIEDAVKIAIVALGGTALEPDGYDESAGEMLNYLLVDILGEEAYNAWFLHVRRLAEDEDNE